MYERTRESGCALQPSSKEEEAWTVLESRNQRQPTRLQQPPVDKHRQRVPKDRDGKMVEGAISCEGDVLEEESLEAGVLAFGTVLEAESLSSRVKEDPVEHCKPTGSCLS